MPGSCFNMAERRMFAKTIIDSDAFLEMPQSTQLLYFHLSMRADDDGFINKPKTIMLMIGCKNDDMAILTAKKFIIPFEAGIVVIKHWKIHNYIQKDRYNETKYKELKGELELDENGAYTKCVQDVHEMDTQVRLELGKDREEIQDPAPPCAPAPIESNQLVSIEGRAFLRSLSDKEKPKDPLYYSLWDSFLAITPRFSNYGREGKSCHALCKAIRNLSPKDPLQAAKAILTRFNEKRESSDKFWKGQPFTPSGLLPLLDRVVADLQTQGKEIDPDIIAEVQF